MKKLISILIPIVIAIISTVIVNTILDKKIEILCKTKNISATGKEYGDPIKDKSAVIKDLLSEKGDLFLLGSSELGTNVEQNPMNLFPITDAEYQVSCFGRAYAQDLQQATYLGATNLQPNSKVTLMLSIQWFEDKNAIQSSHFAVNFSDMQFYKFLNNPKISETNKQYYANRVYKFLMDAKKYPAEALYAKLYANPTTVKKGLMLILEPYYKIKEYLLNIKDKALIYKKLSKLPDSNTSFQPAEVNWKEEQEKVSKYNENIVSTNEFNINDDWYNKNLKNQIGKHKGESKDESPVDSQEMNDYKFFLDVCKDLGIEPYIVMMPVNGWYYDYTGLTKDKRTLYYDKAKEIAETYNFDLLDLRDHEYEKGFLIDAKHLGQQGWLKASEGIYNHFTKEK